MQCYRASWSNRIILYRLKSAKFTQLRVRKGEELEAGHCVQFISIVYIRVLVRKKKCVSVRHSNKYNCSFGYGGAAQQSRKTGPSWMLFKQTRGLCTQSHHIHGGTHVHKSREKEKREEKKSRDKELCSLVYAVYTLYGWCLYISSYAKEGRVLSPTRSQFNSWNFALFFLRAWFTPSEVLYSAYIGNVRGRERELRENLDVFWLRKPFVSAHHFQTRASERRARVILWLVIARVTRWEKCRVNSSAAREDV